MLISFLNKLSLGSLFLFRFLSGGINVVNFGFCISNFISICMVVCFSCGIGWEMLFFVVFGINCLSWLLLSMFNLLFNFWWRYICSVLFGICDINGSVSVFKCVCLLGVFRLICGIRLLNRNVESGIVCFICVLNVFLFFFCISVLGFLLLGKNIKRSWWLFVM